MAKGKAKGPKPHKFRNKLILNQWLLTLFGINPLNNDKKRPFHKLADSIRDPRQEGLDKDNLHHFFHALTTSDLFFNEVNPISRAQLLVYEENIVRHTQATGYQFKTASTGGVEILSMALPAFCGDLP